MSDNDNNGQERRIHNGEILRAIQEMNSTITIMAKDVSYVKTKVELVDKHEMVLYGSAEDPIKGGLIKEVREVKADFRWLKGIGLALWTFITFSISLAAHFIKKN